LTVEDELAALQTTLSGASAMTAAFQAELQSLQGTMLYTGREVSSMSRSIGGGLRRAFDGVVFDGMRLSDALRTVASSMVDAAYNTAMRPVQNAVGGAIATGVNGLLSGLLPFQHGGAISQGRVMPFARGGIVRGPTTFPMRGGLA
jgi:phage-related minor tail protein